VAILVLAAVTEQLGPYAAVMGAGFLVGVYGHVIKSTALILTGILVVGVVSAYFAFFVAKVGG
jgi:hypothetical protein